MLHLAPYTMSREQRSAAHAVSFLSRLTFSSPSQVVTTGRWCIPSSQQYGAGAALAAEERRLAHE
jgi:hypothetical protein